jgi:hypothetical protein
MLRHRPSWLLTPLPSAERQNALHDVHHDVRARSERLC